MVLYLQGGVANLLALSRTLETEFRSIPDFSSGMLVGVAIVAVLVLGFRPRARLLRYIGRHVHGSSTARNFSGPRLHPSL